MPLIAALTFALGAQSPNVAQRVSDHVYMKSGGAAFTYDVFKPKKTNGIAMIFVVSGGWVSDHKNISEGLAEMACRKGLTLIQVVHGAQPRYKMNDIVPQIHRAVRDIRLNAKTWGVNPTKFGICGGSAGGHLSLMVASQASEGKYDANDPLANVTSEVQAAGVFFPPTDMLNWGKPDAVSFDNPLLRNGFGGAFEIDAKSSREKLIEVAKMYSPAQNLKPKMPPCLLIHGDKDLLVPIQQSTWFKEKMEANGSKCEIVTVPGVGHGWKNMEPQNELILDFFKRVLL
jgi:acetyl esterase/lipase